jgi:replicative DNA helicase
VAGPGLGVLHKILLDKKPLSILRELSLPPEAFVDEERIVFDWILNHFETYGELPKIKTVEVETSVKLRGFPDEPLEYWVGRVKNRNARRMILSSLDDVRDFTQDDSLEEAQEALKGLILALNQETEYDMLRSLSDVANEVLEAHDTRQYSFGMAGVPFGIEYLDEVSDGAQPTDTVALVGRPSAGKTYFLLSMALNAWKTGKVPLVMSMEMSPLQVVRRLIALYSNVPVTTIRLGRLSLWGRRKLVENINGIADMSEDVPFHVMQGSLTSTVEDLVMQIQELKPSVLYVDGAYMLRSRERSAQRWERVQTTAEFLKRIAADYNIPVLASYQFNRRGPGSLGNIGGSDAVGQLASIVLSITDEDEDGGIKRYGEREYKLIELIKGREGEKGTVRVIYDMRRMMIEQESVVEGYQRE